MAISQVRHINVEAISDYIKNKNDFAVVNVIFDKDDWRNKDAKRYFIAPILKDQDGNFYGREGCVYDNLDSYCKVIMSKEEMVVNFGLMFGKHVDYEFDENFTYHSGKDTVSITNFRQI